MGKENVKNSEIPVIFLYDISREGRITKHNEK